MPDRIIRTVHGPTGGLLVIIGAYLLGLGGWWLLVPTESRSAGVQWINDSAHIPITGLTSAHVAWWWTIIGAITLVGGLWSRRAWLERAAIGSAIFGPLLIAAVFIGAWVDGDAPTGGTAAWSYALPSVIVLWQVSHERRRTERGDTLTGPLPIISKGV